LTLWPQVNILFQTTKLRKLCEQRSVMVKKLGDQGARKLRSRLADIDAATFMTDVKRGNPHLLSGDRKGCLALDLHAGWRLVLVPATEPLPVDGDEEIDWARVDAVEVVEIGDYHD